MATWNDPGTDVSAMADLMQQFSQSVGQFTEIIVRHIDGHIERKISDLLATELWSTMTPAEMEGVGRKIRSEMLSMLNNLSAAATSADVVHDILREDVVDAIVAARQVHHTATNGLTVD